MLFDGLRDALRERATKVLRIKQIPKRSVVPFEDGNQLSGIHGALVPLKIIEKIGLGVPQKQSGNLSGTMRMAIN